MARPCTAALEAPHRTSCLTGILKTKESKNNVKELQPTIMLIKEKCLLELDYFIPCFQMRLLTHVVVLLLLFKG